MPKVFLGRDTYNQALADLDEADRRNQMADDWERDTLQQFQQAWTARDAQDADVGVAPHFYSALAPTPFIEESSPVPLPPNFDVDGWEQDALGQVQQAFAARDAGNALPPAEAPTPVLGEATRDIFAPSAALPSSVLALTPMDVEDAELGQAHPQPADLMDAEQGVDMRQAADEWEAQTRQQMAQAMFGPEIPPELGLPPTTSVQPAELAPRVYPRNLQRAMRETAQAADIPGEQQAPTGDWVRENIAKPLMAGTGQFASNLGSALEMVGARDIGTEIRTSGEALVRANVTPAVEWEGIQTLLNPGYYRETVLKNIPAMAGILGGGVAAGAAVYGAAIGAGVSVPVAATLAVIARIGGGRALESTLEAGQTYSDALQKGWTEEQAGAAARETFMKNSLLTGTDAVQFALDFARLPGPTRKVVAQTLEQQLGTIGVGVLKALGSAGSEGVEEVAQEVIQRQSLQEPIDATGLEQAFYGGATGGLAFHAGAKGAEALADTAERLGPTLRQQGTRAAEAVQGALQSPAQLQPALATADVGGVRTAPAQPAEPVGSQQDLMTARALGGQPLPDQGGSVWLNGREFEVTRPPHDGDSTLWVRLRGSTEKDRPVGINAVQYEPPAEQPQAPVPPVAEPAAGTGTPTLLMMDAKIEQAEAQYQQALNDWKAAQAASKKAYDTYLQNKTPDTQNAYQFASRQSAVAGQIASQALQDLNTLYTQLETKLVQPEPAAETETPTAPVETEPAQLAVSSVQDESVDYGRPVEVTRRTGRHVETIQGTIERTLRDQTGGAVYEVNVGTDSGGYPLTFRYDASEVRFLDKEREAVQPSTSVETSALPVQSEAGEQPAAPEPTATAERQPSAQPLRAGDRFTSDDTMYEVERINDDDSIVLMVRGKGHRPIWKPTTLKRQEFEAKFGLTYDQPFAAQIESASTTEQQPTGGLFAGQEPVEAETTFVPLKMGGEWKVVQRRKGKPQEVVATFKNKDDAIAKAQELARQSTLKDVGYSATTGQVTLRPEDLIGRSQEASPRQLGLTETKEPEVPVQPQLQEVVAPKTTFATSPSDPNDRYEFRLKVVPLDSLITSNTDTFAPNPAFMPELQERNRVAVVNQLRVDETARKLSPHDILFDGRSLDRGPMIIGDDRMVESGNGRVMALRRARALYPERWQAYQTALREELAPLGLSEQQVAGIQDPVLVRERITPVNREAFTRLANQSSTMERSDVENARTDARRFSSEMIASLEIGENQSIEEALLRAANRPIVQAFMASVPPNEQGPLMAPDGRLNQAGLNRLKYALLLYTYSGDAGQMLSAVFINRSEETRIKNIEAGIFASLPAMARTEALMRRGERDARLSIAEDVAKVVWRLEDLRQQGISVENYLGQFTLWERNLTPLQEQLLAHLAKISAKANQWRPVREFLEAYAQKVEGAAPPNQPALSLELEENARPTKEDYIARLTGTPRVETTEVPTAPRVHEELARPESTRVGESGREISESVGSSTGTTAARAKAVTPTEVPLVEVKKVQPSLPLPVSQTSGGEQQSLPPADTGAATVASEESVPPPQLTPATPEGLAKDATPAPAVADTDGTPLKSPVNEGKRDGDGGDAPPVSSESLKPPVAEGTSDGPKPPKPPKPPTGGPSDKGDGEGEEPGSRPVNPPPPGTRDEIDLGLIDHLVGTGYWLPDDMIHSARQEAYENARKQKNRVTWWSLVNDTASHTGKTPEEIAELWGNNKDGQQAAELYVLKSGAQLAERELAETDVALNQKDLDEARRGELIAKRADLVVQYPMYIAALNKASGEHARAMNILRMRMDNKLAERMAYQYRNFYRLVQEVQKNVERDMRAGKGLSPKTKEKLKAVAKALEKDAKGDVTKKAEAPEQAMTEYELLSLAYVQHNRQLGTLLATGKKDTPEWLNLTRRQNALLGRLQQEARKKIEELITEGKLQPAQPLTDEQLDQRAAAAVRSKLERLEEERQESPRVKDARERALEIAAQRIAQEIAKTMHHFRLADLERRIELARIAEDADELGALTIQRDLLDVEIRERVTEEVKARLAKDEPTITQFAQDRKQQRAFERKIAQEIERQLTGKQKKTDEDLALQYVLNNRRLAELRKLITQTDGPLTSAQIDLMTEQVRLAHEQNRIYAVLQETARAEVEQQIKDGKLEPATPEQLNKQAANQLKSKLRRLEEERQGSPRFLKAEAERKVKEELRVATKIAKDMQRKLEQEMRQKQRYALPAIERRIEQFQDRTSLQQWVQLRRLLRDYVGRDVPLKESPQWKALFTTRDPRARLNLLEQVLRPGEEIRTQWEAMTTQPRQALLSQMERLFGGHAGHEQVLQMQELEDLLVQRAEAMQRMQERVAKEVKERLNRGDPEITQFGKDKQEQTALERQIARVLEQRLTTRALPLKKQAMLSSEEWAALPSEQQQRWRGTMVERAARMESERLGRGIEAEIARDTLDRIQRVLRTGVDRDEVDMMLKDLALTGQESSLAAQRFITQWRLAQARNLMTREEKQLPHEQFKTRQQQLANELATISWTDQRALQRFANALHREEAWRNLHAWRIASMLSGTGTLIINAAGGGFETGWAFPLRAVEAKLEGASARKRMHAEFAGMVEALPEAWAEFQETLRTGLSSRPIRELYSYRADPLQGGAKNPLNYVFRVLAATDDFWRTLNMGGALATETQREMDRINKDRRKAGLSDVSFYDVWNNFIDYPDVVERASTMAGRRTYTQQGSEWIQQAERMRRASALGHIFLPFLNTVLRMSEIGFERAGGGAWAAFRKGQNVRQLRKQAGQERKAGAERLAQETEARSRSVDLEGTTLASEAILGSVLLLSFGALAAAGLATAYGPRDEKERKDWLDQGGQPFSVKIGDKWVSYSNMGAFAVPLAVATSVMEAHLEGQRKQDLTATLVSAITGLGNVWLDMTALKGATDLLLGVVQPTRHGERLIEGLTTSMVPAGGFFATIARVLDSGVKDPDDVLEAVMARLPVVSRQVPNRLTQLGEEKQRGAQGFLALLPLRMSIEMPEPILEEFQRLRSLGYSVSIGQAGRAIDGVKLEPDEYRDYQALLGLALRKKFEATLRSSLYQTMPPEKQAKRLSDEERKIRNEVREKFKQMMNWRLRTQQQKRQVEAKRAALAR